MEPTTPVKEESPVSKNASEETSDEKYDKYRDIGVFNFDLLVILSNGVNSIVYEMQEHNRLLQEQNDLIKSSNRLD